MTTTTNDIVLNKLHIIPFEFDKQQKKTNKLTISFGNVCDLNWVICTDLSIDYMVTQSVFDRNTSPTPNLLTIKYGKIEIFQSTVIPTLHTAIHYKRGLFNIDIMLGLPSIQYLFSKNIMPFFNFTKILKISDFLFYNNLYKTASEKPYVFFGEKKKSFLYITRMETRTLYATKLKDIDNVLVTVSSHVGNLLDKWGLITLDRFNTDNQYFILKSFGIQHGKHQYTIENAKIEVSMQEREIRTYHRYTQFGARQRFDVHVELAESFIMKIFQKYGKVFIPSPDQIDYI